MPSTQLDACKHQLKTYGVNPPDLKSSLENFLDEKLLDSLLAEIQQKLTKSKHLYQCLLVQGVSKMQQIL